MINLLFQFLNKRELFVGYSWLLSCQANQKKDILKIQLQSIITIYQRIPMIGIRPQGIAFPEITNIYVIVEPLYLKTNIFKMSCYSYSCQYDCCDYYGYCPTLRSDCYYYYYKNSTLTGAAIAGIIIGIFFFILFVILLVYFCRRCQERQYASSQPIPPPVYTNTEIITMQPVYPGQVPPYYGQPMVNKYAQPYPYNQNEMNPSNQPNPYNQPPPYNL